MKKATFGFSVTFTEPVLGMASGNPDIQEEFIAAKSPTVESAKEEVDSIPVSEKIEKASTVFSRDQEGFVHVWNYQWRGFFKEQLLGLIELGDITHLGKWTYKRSVDSFLFVNPRRIHLLDASGNKITGKLENLQRPLRATTMQGDRICLARSEMLPAGTNCQFEVVLLLGSNPKSKVASITPEDITACMEYGSMKGWGQWRGGGYGRFNFKQTD